jgi:hypothetical protein
MAVGVSPECFRGDTGGSLVVADSPGHDAARVSELQRIPGVLRGYCDEYFGRPAAEADGSWNHHYGARSIGRTESDLLSYSKRHRSGASAYGDGALGSGARKNRKSSACPGHPKGQGEIPGGCAATLGWKDNPFITEVTAHGTSLQCFANSYRELRTEN